MKLENPQYRHRSALGETEESWQALRDKLLTWFGADGRDAQQGIEESEARAIDPKFADQLLWNQLLADMGIKFLPEPAQQPDE